MKNALMIVLFVVTRIDSQCSHCSEPAAAATPIEQLESDDFDMREKATAFLMKLRKDEIEPLKKAMTEKTEKHSKDFMARANRIVDFIEGGGEIVNGLKIKLAANKDTVKSGDRVMFAATAYNTTNKPMNLVVGSFSDNGVQQATEIGLKGGDFYRVLRVQEENGEQKELELKAKSYRYMWGEYLMHSIVITVAPYECLALSVEAKFSASDAPDPKSKLERAASYSFGLDSHSGATLLVPAEDHRIRIVFSNSETPQLNDKDLHLESVSGGAGDPKAAIWIGTVRSNDLCIKCKK